MHIRIQSCLFSYTHKYGTLFNRSCSHFCSSKKVDDTVTTKSTIIFYFSASGNSLALARDIAEKTKGKLVSIPSVMNKESLKPQTDAVGIVFPVYYASNGYGIPLIVERFVNKLEGIGSNYFFAVCTHSGMAGETIEKLKKQINPVGAN